MAPGGGGEYHRGVLIDTIEYAGSPRWRLREDNFSNKNPNFSARYARCIVTPGIVTPVPFHIARKHMSCQPYHETCRQRTLFMWRSKISLVTVLQCVSCGTVSL
ncbi:hypothetical protein HOLleu_30287 [Holothuria leucospilota]|uniref:Uncharacterized protein n=1 Tax=Holothuria leucospilota TaxID=206669 RepID=A0A9Q1BK55_HOLLE|nr:hypothetical protein HOLleu_30287 [Holothuria leucospilota]